MASLSGAVHLGMQALFDLSLFVVHLIAVARAITRANRTPAARVAWMAVIMLLPLLTTFFSLAIATPLAAMTIAAQKKWTFSLEFPTVAHPQDAEA